MKPMFAHPLSILAATVLGLASIAAVAATPAPQKSAPAAKKEAKPTDIVLWHSMDDTLGVELDTIAEHFNASQREWRIVPEYKGSYEKALEEGLSAQRAGKGPHVMQVVEVGTASVLAQPKIYKPVFQLMAETGEKLDNRSFFPAVSSFFSDSQGRLVAMPFNTSTAVLYINRDAFRKAGLDPEQPPKTWRDVQAAAIKLTDTDTTRCGYTTDWQSWVHLENLTAWHNEPFADKANGFGGLDAKLNFNTILMIRHIGLLSSWVKSGLFNYYGHRNEGEAKFAAGECGLLTSSSASRADLAKNAKFDVGVSPLPYYDEFPGAPYNTAIGGASLWAMTGKKPAEYKGIAKFFAWLSRAEVQADWHQRTGYIPLTVAAYELTRKQGFYDKQPGALAAIRQLTRRTEPYSKGVRLGDFVKIRAVIDEELEAVWTQRKTPKEALDEAVDRGNALLRIFERTNKR